MAGTGCFFLPLRRALFAAALALLLAPAAAAAERPTILVFGDSLSTAYGFDRDEAWPVLLETRLDEADLPHRVTNVSRSGETTSGGTRRLPDALQEHEPEIVLLQLGGNDGLRGQPPERIRSNLARMIEQAHEADSQVLLIGIRIPPSYGRTYTEQFAAIYPELAEEHDLPVIPFLLDGVWDRDGMMQNDGVHPTAEAQPKIAERVWETLRELLDAPS
ncbi:MAG: arylesterase [Halorhodospira halophila]|uniref:arylesterase n=1 Tax=Halorhodospira TaxID=85108 RepID=UPI0019134B11|nr:MULTISPECIES: arylesterase [Halorhodospira]MBK5944382.1 arylesterase [Halorhodospira halophila]MCC3751312.1 arylesterase [Halorhodospira halophila]MCG5527497.1 arylesterase [Halorhodospira halophila]MCG5533679.1 arylesterase [Halorhodospira sp. 9621]MCG5538394.1 arylesterase [Halorhodospira sp. 9622]